MCGVDAFCEASYLSRASPDSRLVTPVLSSVLKCRCHVALQPTPCWHEIGYFLFLTYLMTAFQLGESLWPLHPNLLMPIDRH